MTKRLVFAVPGDLAARTGGYAYDRRMMEELRALGWEVRHLPLPSGFPHPSHADIEETRRLFATIEDDALVLVDGLAFGAMAQIGVDESGRLRLVALVHHPLHLEAGLAEPRADELRHSEEAALRVPRRVVVTSRETARQLEAEFGVPGERLVVAEPGTEEAEPAHGKGAPPLMIALASVIPRKGFLDLVEALEELKGLDWRLRIVGSLERDPAHVEAVRRAIAEAGIEGRVDMAGEVEDAGFELAGGDLFVLASRHEGYGMAFAEAIARGLPVVGYGAGAVPGVVPPQAGILVPPGDVAALREALTRLLSDPALRASYAASARAAGQRLPRWQDSALVLSEALETVR